MGKSRIALSLLLIVLGGVGLKSRSPFLLAWREALPWILPILGAALAWKFRGRKAWALALILAGLIPLGLQRQADSLRERVLAADPEELRRLGRHFLVGYRDFAELETLVARGAVGGVFVTQRNIQGKTGAQVRAELRRLQEIQASQGLPPLYIATDQEGGPVSRLSPLVPAQPSLAVWLRAGGTAQAYADLQARALADLGVNLNFSPVVDLRHPDQDGRFHPHTRIDQRAISADPLEVAEAATTYCLAFERRGLRCTLKHFPGLGQVAVDTHLREGRLEIPRDALEAADWLPFRATLAASRAFLMLGHVRVPELDPELPASLSPAIVRDLIRGSWGHEGVVITDDFTMGPIQGRPGGVGPAARQALEAGVDLILVSYDSELYYEAMAYLLNARGVGQWEARLTESARRLGEDLDRRAVGHQVPDLLDLFVGDGDAAVGPIVEAVRRPEIRRAVGQAVDHDRAAGRDAAGLGRRGVAAVGVRDM